MTGIIGAVAFVGVGLIGVLPWVFSGLIAAAFVTGWVLTDLREYIRDGIKAAGTASKTTRQSRTVGRQVRGRMGRRSDRFGYLRQPVSFQQHHPNDWLLGRSSLQRLSRIARQIRLRVKHQSARWLFPRSLSFLPIFGLQCTDFA